MLNDQKALRVFINFIPFSNHLYFIPTKMALLTTAYQMVSAVFVVCQTSFCSNSVEQETHKKGIHE